MTRIVRCALVWIRFKSLKFKNLKKDKKDKYIENNYQVLGVGKGEELLVPCKMFAHPQVSMMMPIVMKSMMKMIKIIEILSCKMFAHPQVANMIMMMINHDWIQDKLKFRWTFMILLKIMISPS